MNNNNASIITRNKTIDIMKALAIILVVYGHIPYRDGYVGFGGFKMHLFMLVSGYCAFSLSHKNDFAWLKKRTVRLLIPFTVWVVIRLYADYRFEPVQSFAKIKKILVSPDAGYWFLFTLFELCCILVICNLIIDKLNLQKFDFIIYGLAVLTLNILFWKLYIQILGMYLLATYSFAYFLGYLLKKKQLISKYSHIINNKLLCLVVVILSLVIIPSWAEENTSYVILFNSYVQNIHIQRLFLRFLSECIPLLGVYFTYVIARLLQLTPFEKLFSAVGQHSIEVYIMHYYFFFQYGVSILPYCVLNTVVPTAISMFIAYIVESGILSNLLYGTDTKLLKIKKQQSTD